MIILVVYLFLLTSSGGVIYDASYFLDLTLAMGTSSSSLSDEDDSLSWCYKLFIKSSSLNGLPWSILPLCYVDGFLIVVPLYALG